MADAQAMAWVIINSASVPISGLLMLCLSYKHALRVHEIAHLLVGWCLNADGSVADNFLVPGVISKNKRDRILTMSPELRELIYEHLETFPGFEYLIVAQSSPLSDPRPTTTNALTKFYKRMTLLAGLEGASSHSGRRTAITELMRRANNHECSVADVQRFAGHASLNSTAAYIDPSEKVAELVNSRSLW